MKGNRIIATVATLVAGCAIGAGAAVTQGAMAQAPAAEIGDTVTVIDLGTDGNAIECTFTGEAGGESSPILPVDESAPGPVVDSYTVEIADDGTMVVNGVPSTGEVVIGEATTGATGVTEFEVTTDADFVPAEPLPIEVGDIRAGTPEECSVVLSGVETGA